MSPGAAAQSWNLPETFLFEGQQVRYGILGSGEPLVLLHGTPFSSVVWRRIAPHLAGRRQVFYFDLLGYGRSEMRPGQDVSLATQNRLFTALLDHWHIQNPNVVAHDFGGCTALRTSGASRIVGFPSSGAVSSRPAFQPQHCVACRTRVTSYRKMRPRR